jgi:hypothetical protein
MAGELACLPPSADAARFSYADPQPTVNYWWAVADHASNAGQIRTWEREHWRAVEGLASRRAEAWGCVNSLRGTWCSVPCKRLALGRLRDLLGVEDYGAGRLPMPGED